MYEAQLAHSNYKKINVRIFLICLKRQTHRQVRNRKRPSLGGETASFALLKMVILFLPTLWIKHY